MKLLNRSLKWLILPMLLIVSLWTIFLYYSINNEIKGSVDEGLDNYKRQILVQLNTDKSILEISNLDESVFFFHKISMAEALRYKDRYKDTLIYMQDADDLAPELEPVRMLSTAIDHDEEYYELNIIQPMVETDDMVKQLSWNILWLFILLMLTIIITNNLVLQRLWTPFYKILSYLNSYRLGSGKDKLPDIETSTKEFNDLYLSINTLLKQNVTAYQQQKLFIGNASHELQTPLAIVINKLELMIEQGELNNQQAQVISEVSSIIERLIRMNKSLLMLSKIDNKQYIDEQTVSINDIVRHTIEDMSDFIEFKSLSLNYIDEGDISVTMDIALADVIVANLIRNAVFHNIENGNILINTSNNKLSVYNTGTPDSLPASMVFDRFYKSDNQKNGTGLGLSIVKAICDLYGFSIKYEFDEGCHCFIVVFNQ